MGLFCRLPVRASGELINSVQWISQNGFIGRGSWKNGLSSSGKTGKQMGFNKALCKQQVGLGCDSVDDALAA
jgi:hypothetical protein